jgi:hypothetical protein
MRNRYVGLACALAMAVMGTAAAPAGAYVHLADCRSALFGYELVQPDNDIARQGNYFWGSGNWSFDQWMYWNRRSNDEIRQDAGYKTGTTGRVRLIFVCKDGDHSGALQGGEDFYSGWGGQY